MKTKHLVKRSVLLILGLVIMAYGVAFSIRAGLGTSPISSLPYTVSKLTSLTVGTATVIMNCALILLQAALLGRDYSPVQLLQFLVALLFGWLTDFTLMTIESLTPSAYLEQWGFCLVGILLVGIGVSCEVNADLIPMAGEGFSVAVCRKFSFPFPTVKICFDSTLVILSCILSLLFAGKLLGVREGTIAAALLVGMVSKQITKWIIRPLMEHLCGLHVGAEAKNC